MQWLRNLPVSRKFFFAFGIVCGLCVVLGTYSFVTFRGIAQKSANVSENSFPSLLAVANIRNAANNVRREDLDLMLCTTPDCTAAHTTKRQKALADYQSGVKRYEQIISYPGERELYQKFSTAFSQYQATSDRATMLLAAGKAGDALDLQTSNATTDSYMTAFAAMDDDLSLNAKYGTEESVAATAAANRATWINSGITLLIVLLCA